MRYANDYRLIYHPENSNNIYITIPTGETSISNVRKDVHNAVGSIEITEVDLSDWLTIYPGDRIFRNAWKLVANKILEDTKISRNLIREHRNRNLTYLDIVAFRESRKPNGKLDDVNEVSQMLRDITAKASFNSENISDLKSLYQYTSDIVNGLFSVTERPSGADILQFKIAA